jgi:hypothetical protein
MDSGFIPGSVAIFISSLSDVAALAKRAFDARTAEVDEFRPSRPGA